MRYHPLIYQHNMTSILRNCHKWPLLLRKTVKDVNDDDISMKMNKQVPLEDLSPPKVKFNYN
jgi:hypothetical protein